MENICFLIIMIIIGFIFIYLSLKKDVSPHSGSSSSRPKTAAGKVMKNTSDYPPPPEEQTAQRSDEEGDNTECPNCGNKVSTESKSCPICGIEIEKENPMKWKNNKQKEEENKMKCPGCGGFLNPEEVGNFCPYCRESLVDIKTEEESPKENKTVCPNCDRSIQVGEAGICPYCGNNITETGTEETEEVNKVTFECPTCGEEVLNDDTECPNCGVMFEEEGKVEEPEEEGEEAVFEDNEEESYSEKLNKWEEYGFDVSEMKELLENDRMDEFEILYDEMKKQIEGE